MILELLGFFACALIGISLGLIGAGGSILMVPVLVYLFHMPPLLATSYSLFVVGLTSLLAAIGKFRKGDVLLRTALTFGLVSMVVVMVVRHYIIPLMPKSLCSIGRVPITYNWLCMVIFAGLMILAAYSMVKNGETDQIVNHKRPDRIWNIMPYALLMGAVTGFLGAGGGFLIIPVMTLMLGIDIKKAVGTSLAVIALNSLSGFVNDLGHVTINWTFLLIITAIAVVGSLSGAMVSEKINAKYLKCYFGWFILLLGVVIITKECCTMLEME